MDGGRHHGADLRLAGRRLHRPSAGGQCGLLWLRLPSLRKALAAAPDDPEVPSALLQGMDLSVTFLPLKGEEP